MRVLDQPLSVPSLVLIAQAVFLLQCRQADTQRRTKSLQSADATLVIVPRMDYTAFVRYNASPGLARAGQS